MSSIDHEGRSERWPRLAKKMLWPLVCLFFLPLTRSQSIHSSLSLNAPLSLSGNNFSSTPLLFSLPSSSQLTVSIALCTSPSNTPPRVFVSNSSDSQVTPGPNGGPDVFEVILGSLGLGNLTLDAGDTTGVLAVYGGTTSDSLEIGVSQGGKATNLPHLSLLILRTHPHDQQHPSTRP
jgi:calcium channel MID1